MRQARQRQSQVCGVHGRGSSGWGQQVQRRALSNPEPGAIAISPGRRVLRPLTRCHRPWPGCQAPTNPPSRQARPSRSRIAVPPYSPPLGPAGHVLVRPVGPKATADASCTELKARGNSWCWAMRGRTPSADRWRLQCRSSRWSCHLPERLRLPLGEQSTHDADLEQGGRATPRLSFLIDGGCHGRRATGSHQAG
jgi:hypothetical protein